MTIIVTKSELRDALQGLGRIIPAHPCVTVLGCVRFTCEGGITATATDLDQTAVYSFDHAQGEGRGDIIIPLTAVRELARGDAGDTVKFDLQGGRIIITNSLGGHAVTSEAVNINAQDWPQSGPDIRTEEAKGFLKAYRRMAPFAASDETRRTLQCVYIDVSGKGEHNATLVATDGRRLCCCNSLKLPVTDEHGVMVPVTKFLLWAGLPGEAMLGVSGTGEGGRICVRAGKWTYRVKAVDGQYPNWRQVVPSQDAIAHRMRLTDADTEAMKKIIPALPGGDGIGLEGSADGTLNIRGIDGERQVRIPLTAGSAYEGGGCSITVNRAYLLDAVNAGFRNFMFADQISPLLSDDGNGARHVLMPLRYEGPRQPPQVPATAAAAVPPAAEVPRRTEQPKEKIMPQAQKQETPALERLQAAYEQARNKVREAQSALAGVSAAIRDAVKEERKRSDEVAAVRAGLARLQSIKV